jgi:hypothetical protein
VKSHLRPFRTYFLPALAKRARLSAMTVKSLLGLPISGTLVEAQGGRVLAGIATTPGAILGLSLPVSN